MFGFWHLVGRRRRLIFATLLCRISPPRVSAIALKYTQSDTINYTP